MTADPKTYLSVLSRRDCDKCKTSVMTDLERKVLCTYRPHSSVLGATQHLLDPNTGDFVRNEALEIDLYSCGLSGVFRDGLSWRNFGVPC
ncbi:hypothetical protein BaRGS_00033730 [Batillaria attramentaria]|uniref:Uncharacterized protein n=1 Tax=Batillaria attramentaria TaxID=370345 RepID=A0ABD0JJM1_9CAEN